MHKDDKSLLGFLFGAGMAVILFNLLFWGGLIWFALWALSHFGVV